MSGRERYYPVEEARASTVHGVRGLWGAWAACGVGAPTAARVHVLPGVRIAWCHARGRWGSARDGEGGGVYKFAYRLEWKVQRRRG